jgi:hypothetical protein
MLTRVGHCLCSIGCTTAYLITLQNMPLKCVYAIREYYRRPGRWSVCAWTTSEARSIFTDYAHRYSGGVYDHFLGVGHDLW